MSYFLRGKGKAHLAWMARRFARHLRPNSVLIDAKDETLNSQRSGIMELHKIVAGVEFSCLSSVRQCTIQIARKYLDHSRSVARDPGRAVKHICRSLNAVEDHIWLAGDPESEHRAILLRPFVQLVPQEL